MNQKWIKNEKTKMTSYSLWQQVLCRYEERIRILSKCEHVIICKITILIMASENQVRTSKVPLKITIHSWYMYLYDWLVESIINHWQPSKLKKERKKTGTLLHLCICTSQITYNATSSHNECTEPVLWLSIETCALLARSHWSNSQWTLLPSLCSCNTHVCQNH